MRRPWVLALTVTIVVLVFAVAPLVIERYGYVTLVVIGVFIVALLFLALILAVRRGRRTLTVEEVAERHRQSPFGVGEFGSAAELLASGQRVRGVLTAFADTGKTARNTGRTPSRAEFLDDPLYVVDVDLHLPNSAPVKGRNSQRVPRAKAASLAVGLALWCAVDPANPSRRFVVDWGDIPR